MADQNMTAEPELLLDIEVAEASRLYKFYLNQEKKILGASSVALFLIFWEFMGGTWSAYNPIPFLRVNPLFMSAPSLVAKAAYRLFASGEIWNDLKVSGLEFAWGFGLSVIFAIPVGIACGWYRKVAYLCDPFVDALNATPRVALLPLIIIWLGIGIPSKVGIIFLSAIFPIMISAREGVKTTPLNLLNAARSFGASQWQIFRTVVLPSTWPFILTGLRLGVGRSLIGVMVGELFAATAGIGYMITVAGATFQTDKVFVGVFVFALTGVACNEVLTKLERRFAAWRPKVGAA